MSCFSFGQIGDRNSLLLRRSVNLLRSLGVMRRRAGDDFGNGSRRRSDRRMRPHLERALWRTETTTPVTFWSRYLEGPEITGQTAPPNVRGNESRTQHRAGASTLSTRPGSARKNAAKNARRTLRSMHEKNCEAYPRGCLHDVPTTVSLAVFVGASVAVAKVPRRLDGAAAAGTLCRHRLEFRREAAHRPAVAQPR